MKALRGFAELPSTASLPADEILEFHAARILLLLRVAGTAGRIDGLTKMAKLDFFVRYPGFFERVAQHKKKQMAIAFRAVESSMIRFHYGPWDRRYYHVLSYLEAKSLIEIYDQGRAHQITLTGAGKGVADRLRRLPDFETLALHMKAVKKLVGHLKGTTLKKLVYEVFEAEVGMAPMGTRIVHGDA